MQEENWRQSLRANSRHISQTASTSTDHTSLSKRDVSKPSQQVSGWVILTRINTARLMMWTNTQVHSAAGATVTVSMKTLLMFGKVQTMSLLLSVFSFSVAMYCILPIKLVHVFVCVYVTKWFIRNIFTLKHWSWRNTVNDWQNMTRRRSNPYYLWRLSQFADTRVSKREKRKKSVDVAKLIKALRHCSVPQNPQIWQQ